MPKLRHFDHLNTARFVTFSCYHRLQLLNAPPVITAFLDTLQLIRETHRIGLLGYVVMPEHVHLVLHPPDSLKLGPLVGALKSKSGGRIVAQSLVMFPEECRIRKNGVTRRVFWQARCYDHNCRSRETVVEKINYCHNNPVVRGLVREPGEWRWSSFNWYAGRDDVPITMDRLEY